MQISELTTLDLEFDSGYSVINTDFLSFKLTEEVYSLPIVEIVLSISNDIGTQLLSEAKFIDITLTTNGGKSFLKFKVQILSVRTPNLGRTKNAIIFGIFYKEEFIKNFHTKTYKEMSASEVLNSLTSIEVETIDTIITDTYYQFNTSDWEFVNNNLTPYVALDGGVPLIGVSAKNKLIMRNNSLALEKKHLMSSGGKSGVWEYHQLSTDSKFSKDYFIYNRLRSVVKSNYKEYKYLDLEQGNPIIDRPLIIDNGNCSEGHTLNPFVQLKNYLDTRSVIIDMTNSPDSIEFLDYVSLVSSEKYINGEFYATKVITDISKETIKSIHLKKANHG